MCYTPTMAARRKTPTEMPPEGAEYDRTSQVLFALAVRIPDRQKRYLEAVASGLKPLAAKIHANVGEQELESWLNKKDSPFAQALAGVRALANEEWEITKEDATKGFLEAVDAARAANVPQAMVAGWRELVNLHGLAPAPAPREGRGYNRESRLGGSSRDAFSRMSDKELAEAAEATYASVNEVNEVNEVEIKR